MDGGELREGVMMIVVMIVMMILVMIVVMMIKIMHNMIAGGWVEESSGRVYARRDRMTMSLQAQPL